MKKYGILLVFILSLYGCKKQEVTLGENEFYTCSMDPQVMEKKPGHCPICKMELTKITVDPHQSGLKLSEEQMVLANVSLEKAVYGRIGDEKILTAEIVANENLRKSISARVKGRVQHLYFKNVGEKVHVGNLLYELYSEEILTAEKEYLLALQQLKDIGEEGNYAALARSAKNKLLLWGLTEKQIQKLANEKEPSLLIPIYSTVEGIITSVGIQEGEYVEEGTTVFQLSDFSSVWVEAEVYPSELGQLSFGEEAEVRVSGFMDNSWKGQISFVQPQLVSQSKVNLIRIELPNASDLFRPGMQAYVSLKGEQYAALLVSSRSLLQDAKGTHVWIRDTEGKFELKKVETGIQNGDKVEIIKGLQEGDEVVVSGAYLLNSEYVFRKGADPREVEEHVM